MTTERIATTGGSAAQARALEPTSGNGALDAFAGLSWGKLAVGAAVALLVLPRALRRPLVAAALPFVMQRMRR